MYDLLKGLTLIEGSSFVAAPLCGLTFAQLGAEVIRFDQIGGGLDYGRWPLDSQGRSLYWEGLNKGKKSVGIDLSRPQGRELAVALVTAAGEDRGLFITNYPQESFLSHERLAARRADLITLRVTGSSDGRSALDYTVNSAAGYPLMTGPADAPGPVNHVLPAWDIACGLTAATTLLAAERARRRDGRGREIRLALSDVAFATLAALGQVAEVEVNDEERPRLGNALYGAFGRDFRTRDDRWVMICAITRKQWVALLDALQLHEAVGQIERDLEVSFAEDEGLRFIHREPLFALVEDRVAQLDHLQCAQRFEQTGVCWGPYRTVRQAIAEDARLSTDNPMFARVEHASGHRYLTPGFPATIAQEMRLTPGRAPRLGEHTDEVFSRLLGLDGATLGRLHDERLIG
jgi:2-methylfumaryl-CoA isomerase